MRSTNVAFVGGKGEMVNAEDSTFIKCLKNMSGFERGWEKHKLDGFEMYKSKKLGGDCSIGNSTCHYASKG